MLLELWALRNKCESRGRSSYILATDQFNMSWTQYPNKGFLGKPSMLKVGLRASGRESRELRGER